MFTNWVNGGGNLIAMHPDQQLAGLLGLVAPASTLSNAYVLMSTADRAGRRAGGADDPVSRSGRPVHAERRHQLRHAVLERQHSHQQPSGDFEPSRLRASGGVHLRPGALGGLIPARAIPPGAGRRAMPATLLPSAPYNLFYGAASFDPQPDWIDFNKIQIPQADEQQRLLANLILQMNSGKKPLPRFWYLPKGLKAAVVMTGDDHGSFYGGSATAPAFQRFSGRESLRMLGGELGVRPRHRVSVSQHDRHQFADQYSGRLLHSARFRNRRARRFRHRLPGLDDQPSWIPTTPIFWPRWPRSSPACPRRRRTACTASPGATTIRSRPSSSSTASASTPPTTTGRGPGSTIAPALFTGSGMPMRYADRNGNLINVYQAATQMTDESGQSYPLHINTLLDNALSGTGYYGVFTANMHNDATELPRPGSDLDRCLGPSRGVPVVTSLQMLQWLDGRNGSSFGSLSWSGNVLSFSITVGANANNLRAMLPTNFGSLGLSSILLGSSPVTYQLQTIKGVQYAVFAASAGNYQATYGGAPAVQHLGRDQSRRRRHRHHRSRPLARLRSAATPGQLRQLFPEWPAQRNLHRHSEQGRLTVRSRQPVGNNQRRQRSRGQFRPGSNLSLQPLDRQRRSRAR